MGRASAADAEGAISGHRGQPEHDLMRAAQPSKGGACPTRNNAKVHRSIWQEFVFFYSTMMRHRGRTTAVCRPAGRQGRTRAVAWAMLWVPVAWAKACGGGSGVGVGGWGIAGGQ